MLIDGEGHVSRRTAPFILIVGSFLPDQVVEILDGFINTVKNTHKEKQGNIIHGFYRKTQITI